MKKIVSTIVMFLLVFFSIFSLTGCFIDNDEDIAKKNIAKLINVLQKKDHEAVKALFAPSKIVGLENFDKSIDALFAYIDGDHVSHTNGGAGTFNDTHEGRVVKYQKMSHDVTTTKEIYRVAIIWYLQDTGVAENVGIWSFYIIKFDDDPNKAFRYGGDGLWTSGINIGKARPSHD